MYVNFFCIRMKVKSRVRITKILNRHTLRDSNATWKKNTCGMHSMSVESVNCVVLSDNTMQICP